MMKSASSRAGGWQGSGGGRGAPRLYESEDRRYCAGYAHNHDRVLKPLRHARFPREAYSGETL